ncbi:hypothetical protein I79_025197 [Cricetulus griseus]|uniref:Uncharacterized protein n=1 Tax=Cricetulus griseus TaxID=10029 RepID=G3IMQ3_CRIGR|nr:hypothetical protein I79_025197 [Cricetulus griseus]
MGRTSDCQGWGAWKAEGQSPAFGRAAVRPSTGAAEGERPLGVQHGRPEPPAPDFPIQLGGLGWGLADSSAGRMGRDNLPDQATTNLQTGTTAKNSCAVTMLFSRLQAPYPLSGTPRITLACTNRVGDRKFSIIYIIKGTPEQCLMSWQVWALPRFQSNAKLL